MNIVLASSSTYRQQLLDRLQITYTTNSPNIDETRLPDETPSDMVLRLARQKALAVQPQYNSQTIIIASDQVGLAPDGSLLTKPHARDKAIQQLTSYKCREIKFLTSLYVGNTSQHFIDIVEYSVGFRSLSNEDIASYVDKEQPLDCAGSFKAEGLGSALFAYQRGDDPSSLVGLPLIRLCQRLAQLGQPVL